jgi:hypothetical protein
MKRKGFLVCVIALAAALFTTAAEADRRVADLGVLDFKRAMRA